MKNWHENYYRQNLQYQWKPLNDVVSKVRLSLMSIRELLKIVRYSNLFELNTIMDAIDTIHTETNTSTNTNDNKYLKNYRGRLSTI